MAGRILIADDVATNRIILKVKLSRARYETLHAETKQETLEAARSENPDVILLDQALPGGGLETLRQLKLDPATRHIPVIILDGSGSKDRRIQSLRAGADDCLAKPLEESVLMALVRNLMRAHGGRLELARRQSTMTDLGYTQHNPDKTQRPKVTIVAPSPATGLIWRRELGRLLNSHIALRSKAEVLDSNAQTEDTDAFLLFAEAENQIESVRMVSELRSHPSTRNAVIILHIVSGARDNAVLGLDVGADAVTSGLFDPEEMAARLTTLVARKHEMDALRSGFKEQLDLAMIDPLTGVYNRRYANAYLARVTSEMAHADQPLALMLLDLDRFKRVNDTYGHMVGDQVLVETAKRLQDNLRDMDLLARFGGEEFLIAMPGTSLEHARHAARRLHSVIADTPIYAGSVREGITITASIGVAYRRAQDYGPTVVTDMIEEADQALYASKAEGRNLITFGNPEAA
ncbi:MAG: diguanylate cyclase [Maritimibacter sp.]